MRTKVYGNLFGTAIAYVGLGAVLLGAADESRAQVSALTFDANFEDGQVPSYLYVSGNPPVPTREQSRDGGWSLRTFLDRNNSFLAYRTEMTVNSHFTIGGEYWAGISIYFPESHAPSDTAEIVFQVHDTPIDWSRGGQPVLALRSDEGIGGLFQLQGYYNPAYEGAAPQRHAFYARGGTIQAGWNDVVFHWKWAHSEGQGGFTQVWINDTQVLNYSGPNTSNDATGPYVKFGLYKGWFSRTEPADPVSTRLIYHDAYREAGANGSYELVAPRGSAIAVPPLRYARGSRPR
jgi:Polysaccharide lyase